MRCPGCNAENSKDAARCAACDRPFARRGRRRGPPEESDVPPSPYAEGLNRDAHRAYRLAMLGLVPGLGLALGPLGLVLGAIARARGREEPGFTAARLAWAAVVFGGLTGVTNWLGITLMVLGLRTG
jgi:hypothetical protein